MMTIIVVKLANIESPQEYCKYQRVNHHAHDDYIDVLLRHSKLLLWRIMQT